MVSHDEQRRVLKACHSEPTSGHFGVTKMYKRIAEHFYWKGMIADVRELQLLFLLFNGHRTVINSELYCAQQVITCPVCQRMNKKIETGRPELHPIPIKSPWYHSNFKHWTGALSQFPPLEQLMHPTVHVYDSLYSCAGAHLKAQIAATIATEKPELILKFMDVPVQSGTYDCGLFAIAFATALAQGEKPELFFFDQWNMRAHLRQCFEDGEMKMFPVLQKRRVKKDCCQDHRRSPGLLQVQNA